MKPTRFGFRNLLVACLPLVIATSVGATTYYASPGGDNGNSGTSPGSPWKDPSYAVAQLSPGDTLMLLEGTYTSGVSSLAGFSGSPGNYITIQNYNGGNVTFQNTGYAGTAFYFRGTDEAYIHIKGIEIKDYDRAIDLGNGGQNTAHHIILEDLEIVWTGDRGTTGWSDRYGIRAKGYGQHHITVTGCRVHGIPGPGIKFVGGQTNIIVEDSDSYNNNDNRGLSGDADGINTSYSAEGYSDYVTIRRCRAWNNSEDGLDFKSDNVVIEDCQVWGAKSAAVKIWGDAIGGSSICNYVVRNNLFVGNGTNVFTVTREPHLDFYNNTLVNRCVGGMMTFRITDPSTARSGIVIAKNNIFISERDNAKALLMEAANLSEYAVTLDYNVYYNTVDAADCVSYNGITYSNSQVNSGSFGADPHAKGGLPAFVDRANNNLHLTSGDSVARDTGANLAGVGVTHDLDQVSRPQGSAYDRGCYEFLSGPPSAPTNLTAGPPTSSTIPLSWNDNSNNETGFEVDRALNSSFSSGLAVNAYTTGANATGVTATGLSSSTTYYFRARATNAAGDSANSNTANATTQSGGGGGLPSPWQTQDIGAVGATGSATYDSGTSTFTVAGSGADIWGTTDAFRYVYQAVSGDCTIIARVLNQTGGTNQYRKSGVMIRETLDGNSINAACSFNPSPSSSDGRIEFNRRTATGGTTSQSTDTSVAALPYWVKLVRSGNNFSAYWSSDGSSWTQVGTTQTLTMASACYIGLIVCSHTAGTLTASDFSNVTATTGGGNVAVLGDGFVSGTTHAKQTGSNRLLVFFGTANLANKNAGISSVSYGGQSLTKVVDKLQDNTNETYSSIWVLKEVGIAAASTTTFTVTYGNGSPSDSWYASVFLGNVNQTTATGDTASAGTNSGNTLSTLALGTASGDMVLMAQASANNGGFTVNNGFTEAIEKTSGNGDGVVGYKAATGANETPSATLPASTRQALVGAVINGN